MSRSLLCASMLLVLACVGPSPGEGSENEHPCKPEHHCIREDGRSVCAPGFEWEDPSDRTNYRCVQVPPSYIASWRVPSGGSSAEGFYQSSATVYADGYDLWTLVDMNADGRPDLVVTGRTAGGRTAVFGFPNEPHWRVYPGTETGFDAQHMRWTVPSGGSSAEGFYQSSATVYADGYDLWTLVDMNADGRPDLVVTGRTAGGRTAVLGFPNEPHWRVYLGREAGFDAQPIHWAVPSGGSSAAGFYQSSGTVYADGYDLWTLVDMNADGRPDLVVTGRTAGGRTAVFGFPNEPHWRVYPSTGEGFALP